MKSKKALMVILQKILQSIDEGVHVIDNDGITILYNEAMAELEGMRIQDVLGKKLLDIFPSLDHDSSTLLKVLKTEESIINKNQTYLNNRGREITTINSTIALYHEGKKIGALEIAKNITKIKELSDKVIRLQQELVDPQGHQKPRKQKYTFESLVGKSEAFIKAIQMAKRASNSSSSVLIYGETGTGKELFAQSIHNMSNRKNKPFIAQNCAALPESLLEGILFGTVKGGFTGAVDRPGIFEQANGGTILLDEINSMGLQLQAKLLRVLQEGYVRRVGGLKDIPLDVRIIATTNENPIDMISNGIIRKDLYYRLSVINIHIPSLNQRRDDIPFLIEHFINKYNKELDKEVWMVSDGVKQYLMDYSWPGNVRELENVIEGAMNQITDEHILKEEHFLGHPMLFKIEEEKKHHHLELPEGEGDLNFVLKKVERRYIEKALIECGGNVSQAANKLGIKRQTLQHKLKKINMSK